MTKAGVKYNKLKQNESGQKDEIFLKLYKIEATMR